jgi:lysylphosphatidylglycerol synthetase-like protein (DUF2156 family)
MRHFQSSNETQQAAWDSHLIGIINNMKLFKYADRLSLAISGIANIIIVLTALWAVLEYLSFPKGADYGPVTFGSVCLLVSIFSVAIALPLGLASLWYAFDTNSLQSKILSICGIVLSLLPGYTWEIILWRFSLCPALKDWPGLYHFFNQ